jgi:hypothetical protein
MRHVVLSARGINIIKAGLVPVLLVLLLRKQDARHGAGHDEAENGCPA